MAKAKIILPREGYKAAIHSRNHVYYADEPLDAGGTDEAPTPMEMATGALGACIAITIRLYAERKEWPLEGIEVELDIERFRGKDYANHEGDEAYVHEIRKGIKLIGPLTKEQKERLLDIGGKCPVHRLIVTPSFFVEQALADESEPIIE
jgi:putative redox protein